jgi:hypothetical protein
MEPEGQVNKKAKQVKEIRAWGVFTDCGLEAVALSKEKAELQKISISDYINGPEYHDIHIKRIRIILED